jgi:HKD family nuclease
VFTYELAVQSDANLKAVRGLLQRAAGAAAFERLRAAFAYASVGGVQLAAWAIADVSSDWEALDKRWLISFDWGHTDPDALEFLATLPRSQVRVPDAREVLRRNLVPAICFHPKTAIFDRGQTSVPPIAILVGSANLTVSGLETGHEHAAAAVWTSGRLSRDAAAHLAAMQEQGRHADRVWRAATPVTASILDQYRRKWRRARSGERRCQRTSSDGRSRCARSKSPL